MTKDLEGACVRLSIFTEPEGSNLPLRRAAPLNKNEREVLPEGGVTLIFYSCTPGRRRKNLLSRPSRPSLSRGDDRPSPHTAELDLWKAAAIHSTETKDLGIALSVTAWALR
jgi:hypothetical protein